MLDCVIVGAGPAGLTAAVYLARYRRNFVLLDGGPSRAELIPVSHNLPGWPDGCPGETLLERLREQAALHEVDIRKARAETALHADGGFVLRAGDQQLQAATIILATGIVDQHPDFEGLREATLAGAVRWCPICDGFEILDQEIAMLAPAKAGLAHAEFLRTYTKKLTLFALPDSEGLSPEEIARLEAARIELVTEPVVSCHALAQGKGIDLVLGSGETRHFDSFYPMQGSSAACELAVCLGAKRTECGDILVDAHQQTSVPGLYAIGDVVNALNQISVALGHAAIAAAAVHNRLPGNPR